MDIIRICNGLGNQMSDYAFYLAKCQNKGTVYYYVIYEGRYQQHNNFELSRIFGIPSKCPMPKTLEFLLKFRFFNPQKKKSILRFLTKTFFIKDIWENSDWSFNHSLYQNSNSIKPRLFLNGWHSWKYFEAIEPLIRQTFQFDISKLNAYSKMMLRTIRSTNSISIHVRKGDYTGTYFENVCTKEYYRAAITQIKSILLGQQIHFYVFSDDIPYSKTIFDKEDGNFNYLDGNDGNSSWMDMCLMSYCCHNIIANSTFSWWAAWLNNNPSKIILIPNGFVNDRPTPEFFPKEWKQVEY